MVRDPFILRESFCLRIESAMAVESLTTSESFEESLVVSVQKPLLFTIRLLNTAETDTPLEIQSAAITNEATTKDFFICIKVSQFSLFNIYLLILRKCKFNTILQHICQFTR